MQLLKRQVLDWAWIISNEEMDHIMKIINSLAESVLLMKGVSKKIKNEAKEQKDVLLGMLLGTLGDSFLENLLIDKGVMRASERTIRAGEGIFRADEGIIRAGQNF